MVFAITIGMTSGVISAVRRNSAYDYSFMLMATLGIAIPNFVLAAMLIVIFVFNLQMFQLLVGETSVKLSYRRSV